MCTQKSQQCSQSATHDTRMFLYSPAIVVLAMGISVLLKIEEYIAEIFQNQEQNIEHAENTSHHIACDFEASQSLWNAPS